MTFENDYERVEWCAPAAIAISHQRRHHPKSAISLVHEKTVQQQATRSLVAA
jgi:hypothetical protein